MAPLVLSGQNLTNQIFPFSLPHPRTPGRACSQASLHTKRSSISPLKVSQTLTSALLRILFFARPHQNDKPLFSKDSFFDRKPAFDRFSVNARPKRVKIDTLTNDDVGSHLQRNTADSFSLAKNKVLTLNECRLRFYLFYTTTLRPPESFESLSSMAKKLCIWP